MSDLQVLILHNRIHGKKNVKQNIVEYSSVETIRI
jgi:hypothetical protein